MKNAIKKTLAAFIQSQPISKNKRIVRSLVNLSKILSDNFKFFEYKTTVTFHLTTQEQNVNHAKFAELFGIAREKFGLETIPNFKEDVGKKYLLKTRHANYVYLKDFCFGETMHIKLFVSEIDDISFTLIGLFISSGILKTIGEQKIIYANINNEPERIPSSFKSMIESICIPIDKFLK